jgi:hypothetical protein
MKVIKAVSHPLLAAPVIIQINVASWIKTCSLNIVSQMSSHTGKYKRLILKQFSTSF